MRRVGWVGARLAMLAVVGSLAVAVAQGKNSPGDRVTGHGVQGSAFSFNIRSGPGGKHPHGKMRSKGNFVARVTCLKVSGKTAIATGRMIRPKDHKGQPVVMEAVAGNAKTALLRYSFNNGGITGSGKCLNPVLPPVPIQQGHIKVRP